MLYQFFKAIALFGLFTFQVYASQAWIDHNLNGLEFYFQGNFSSSEKELRSASQLLELEFEEDSHVERLLVQIRLAVVSKRAGGEVDLSFLERARPFKSEYVKLIDPLVSLYGLLEGKEKSKLRQFLLGQIFNHLTLEFYQNYPLHGLQYQALVLEEAQSLPQESQKFWIEELEERGEPYGSYLSLKDSMTVKSAIPLLKSSQDRLERLVALVRERADRSLSLAWLAGYSGILIPVIDELLDYLERNSNQSVTGISNQSQAWLSLLSQELQSLGIEVNSKWYGPQNTAQLEKCKKELSSLGRSLSFYEVERGALPALNFNEDSNKAMAFFRTLQEQGYYQGFHRSLVRMCFWDLKVEMGKLSTSYRTQSLVPPQK